MTFDEAMKRCLPGQYVKRVADAWNEHHLQYGRAKDGEAFWTAGITCGGRITDKIHQAAMKHTDYCVHNWWQDHDPALDEIRAARRQRADEARDDYQMKARTRFLEQVAAVTDTAAATAILHGVPRRTADLVTSTLTKDLLNIIDGDAKNPGYRLSERAGVGHVHPDSAIQPSISGSLERYFDEINT